MDDHPFDALVAVMAKLRDPDGGCPWDLEQSFETIVPYTIEEAYEVADAVRSGDMDHLREELGDLLLQSVYHAQMAREDEQFDIYDVLRGVTKKMIDRHPHVFGDRRADDAEDVNAIWDAQKEKEKPKESALDGVARALPALLRAEKLQARAAKAGFEWTELAHVLDKLEEEIGEMRAALKAQSLAAQAEELGDIVFVLVNFARMLGISAETVLRQCNEKFEERFRGMEQDFKRAGISMGDVSLEDMTASWNRQKQKKRA